MYLMATCAYKTTYVEKNGEPEKPYECTEEALAGQDRCHFHNRKYSLANSDLVMDKFWKHIKYTIYNNDQSKALMCVGFHIPGELNFDLLTPEILIYTEEKKKSDPNFNPKKFIDSAYFTRAEFHQKVTFKDFKFHGYANFHYARFHKHAIFSNTKFLVEANFSNAHFMDNAYFTGTPRRSTDGESKFTTFEDNVIFYHAIFEKPAFFSGVEFKGYKTNFTHIDFKDDVDFDPSAYEKPMFPVKGYQELPIKFDDTTFRKRVRFLGEPASPLFLGSISLKSVDLTNAVFHNVSWIKTGIVWKRNAILDELRLPYIKSPNFDDVSGIYNQLRKNYEANLFYDDASDFYVGNMEIIRKKLSRSNIWKKEKVWEKTRTDKRWRWERKLWRQDEDPRRWTDGEWKSEEAKWIWEEKQKRSLDKQGIRDRFKAGVYWMYRLLNQYGESTFVPLLVWTPLIITIFAGLRYYDSCVVFQNPQISQAIPIPEKYIGCDFPGEFVNSLFAYFQFPLEEGWDRFLDTIERIVSAPILAIAIKSFALTKRFETAIR